MIIHFTGINHSKPLKNGPAPGFCCTAAAPGTHDLDQKKGENHGEWWLIVVHNGDSVAHEGDLMVIDDDYI